MLPERGQTGWDLNPNGYDFDFFDDLYDHLTAGLCIDTDRVFSTGHSFGGYMSNSLGCYRADVLSAIAPVAGGPVTWFGGCSGSVAALVVHGTGDSVVEFAQGQAAVNQWHSANSCSDASVPSASGSCVAYEGCERDVHWCEHDGGHEWPSFTAGAVWDFFEAQ